MKLVTAIIKPSRTSDVRDALSHIGVKGLTVTEVKGVGNQKGHAESYRSASYDTEYSIREKVEVVIDDSIVERVVETITHAARSGQQGEGRIGDGKIFIFDVVDAVRIRTGERSGNAVDVQARVAA